MRGPRWLYEELPSLPIGLATLVVCAVLAVFGVSLVRSALRRRRKREQWELDCWVGVFMTGDSFLYALLTVNILESETTQVWVSALFLVIAFPALMAFRAWARGG